MVNHTLKKSKTLKTSSLTLVRNYLAASPQFQGRLIQAGLALVGPHVYVIGLLKHPHVTLSLDKPCLLLLWNKNGLRFYWSYCEHRETYLITDKKGLRSTCPLSFQYILATLNRLRGQGSGRLSFLKQQHVTLSLAKPWLLLLWSKLVSGIFVTSITST